MDVNKNLFFGSLFEVYKSLLTSKQQGILNDFLNRDISISEIAVSENSTRQAVNDIIKRTLKTLENYEEKLKILEKFELMQQEIDKLKTVASGKRIDELEKIIKNMDKINGV